MEKKNIFFLIVFAFIFSLFLVWISTDFFIWPEKITPSQQSTVVSIESLCFDSVSLAKTLICITNHAYDLFQMSTVREDKKFYETLDSLCDEFKQEKFTSTPAIVDTLCRVIFETWEIDFDRNQDTILSILPSCVWQRKYGSCFGISLIFLLFAEKLNIPLFGVIVPDHFFIRYADSLVIRNIETIRQGYRYSDMYYLQRYPAYGCDHYVLQNLTTQQTVGMVYYMMGTLCLKHKKYLEAQDFFQKSRILLPFYAPVLGNAAIASMYSQSLDSAEMFFEYTVELCPSLKRLWQNYGSFEVLRHNYTRAVKIFQKGLVYNQGDNELLYGCGYAFSKLKEHDSARVYLLRLQQHGPWYEKSQILMKHLNK